MKQDVKILNDVEQGKHLRLTSRNFLFREHGAAVPVSSSCFQILLISVISDNVIMVVDHILDTNKL